MATERADCETVVSQDLSEFVQLGSVLEHRQLAMRIARIISRAEFDGIDVLRFERRQDIRQ
jgi:hypothetical protein